MSVLGTGTQGCVIWPALVLASSSKINEGNKREQVSKLAVDAAEEYELCMEIRRRLSAKGFMNVGVFSVELSCGVSQSDLGANVRAIVNKCSKPFAYSLQQYLTEEPDVLCAEVFPRQTQDLKSFQEVIQKWSDEDSRNSFVRLLQDSAKDKLQKLHDVKVVHCDLSATNLAIFGNPKWDQQQWPFRFHEAMIQLADFGLSRIVDTPVRILDAGDQQFSNEFWSVFLARRPRAGLFQVQTGLLFDMQSSNAAKASVVLECLKLFDQISLAGAFNALWSSDDLRAGIISELNQALIKLDQSVGPFSL